MNVLADKIPKRFHHLANSLDCLQTSGGSGSVHSLNKGRDNDQAKGYWYGDGHRHLVNTILHLSLLTAAKLGAGASSVWREAASSYLETFEMFSSYNFL